ncbi:CPBP family intramembrane glutamic endopeptidase [Lutibacter sp.]
MKNNNIGWQRVLKIIIPYIFIVGFFQFVGGLMAGIDFENYKPGQENIKQNLVIIIFNLLGTFFVLWIFMKFVDKEKFINLGFRIKNRLKDFFYGIVLSALIIVAGYFLLSFIGEIDFKEITINQREIILTTLIFAIVSIVEEIIFRGYVLRNLMISFNRYIALIITSFLFSVVHGFNPNYDLMAFTNLFFAGIFLGISYIFTKNLWFPIGLHFSWNLTQTFMGFNVSGRDAYSIVNFKIPESNNILNGGDFGFEGSIFSFIAQIVFVVVIWYYYKQKPASL